MRLTAAVTIALCASAGWAGEYVVQAPGGMVKATVSDSPTLSLTVQSGDDKLLQMNDIALQLDSGVVPAAGAKVTGEDRRLEDAVIKPPVAFKNAEIRDHFRELKLKLDGGASLVVRAYDDGIAYRLETALPGKVQVKTEQCNLAFPQETKAWYSVTKRWMNEYSDLYEHTPVSEITTETVYLPMLLDVAGKTKVLVTESDVEGYPGLYFTGADSASGNTLASILPPAVKSEKVIKKPKRRWDRIFEPKESHPYIAQTSGTRTYPWRVFAVANKDTDLLNNEIVYRLGAPSRIADPSWIKPGLVAWDWWNANNITGVDFRSGINNDTYKYFIDFAAKNNIPYVVLDEGWYELGDAVKLAPDINVKELVDYGKAKNVDIILWCVWRTLDEKLDEALDLYAQWGVKGIKIDFMNRDDQDVMNFYYRCAEAAAKRKMLVNYHGCHKPDGIQRTWPNVITFEAVSGLEQAKWSDTKADPVMAVSLPYLRMFTGPMDYTPGAMRNAQKKEFRYIFNYPMSMGTRCQQLAMYVVYESPLQMMSDLPTAYEKEQECVDFITKIPVTWDRTIPLDGKFGEFIVTARQKGSNYYMGAMTNWTARDIELDFSFLPEGNFTAEIFQDGINADKNGIDYKKVSQAVKKGEKVKFHLAPGGGWAAIITPTTN